MKMLDFKNRKKVLKIEKVQLDEETYVCVRELTARERDLIEQKAYKTNPKGASDDDLGFSVDLLLFRKLSIIYSLCDDDGKAIITEKDWDSFMDSLSTEEYNKIWVQVSEINKLLSAKETADLAKN